MYIPSDKHSKRPMHQKSRQDQTEYFFDCYCYTRVSGDDQCSKLRVQASSLVYSLCDFLVDDSQRKECQVDQLLKTFT